MVGTPGRNEPCPCGSGKKYKKCCAPPQPQAPPQPLSLPKVIACLMRAIVDIQQAELPPEERRMPEMEIPKAMYDSIPVGLGLAVNVQEDVIVLKLIEKPAAPEKPNLLLPKKNIILPGE